jgi:hypothetical protein
MNGKWWCLPLLLATGVVWAEEAAKPEPADPAAPAAQAAAETKDGPKTLEGMSILGNQEAPKALVIVPWKSSELGASRGISPVLDDSRQPVDREVFLRALSYYEIRSESNATQTTTASRRSK